MVCLGPMWGSMTSRSRPAVAMSISPRTWMTVASSVALTSVEKFSTIERNFAGHRPGGDVYRRFRSLGA